MSADEQGQAVPDVGAASPRLVGEAAWDALLADADVHHVDGAPDLQRMGGAILRSLREACVVSTVEELDALPVGAVVVSLWTPPPLRFVAQRYSDGWYGFPNSAPCFPQFPLGTGRNGETALLVWSPEWEA